MNSVSDTLPAPRRFNPLHLGWGVGSLGAALFLNSINFMLLFFMVTVLHINPAVAGLILTVGKLWDMLFNPLLGMASDRTQSRWGRRRPYLLLGAVICSVGFLLLWSPPHFQSERSLIIYMTVMFLLVSSGYTTFNVPYMAMPAEMIDNYQERSAMIGYRVVFIAIGTLVGGSGAKLLVEQLGNGRDDYAKMGMIIGAGVFFFMALCCVATRRARFTLREAQHYSFADQFRTAAGNRPFLALLAAKFLQLLALASVGPIILFLFKFVLGHEKPGELILFYGLVTSGVQIVTVPIWHAIGKRLERRGTFILAAVVFVVGSLSWYLSSPGESLAVLLLRAAVNGFGASGLLLMGQSMLPDVTEYDYRCTGLRREGIFSGFYSFVEKTAFAIAPAIVGFVLAACHFNRTSQSQPPEALQGILFLMAGLPSLYFVFSIFALYFYDLTEAKLKATVRV